jgi:hypothetical protein
MRALIDLLRSEEVKKYCRNRDSSVDIVTGYGLHRRDSIRDRGKKFLYTPRQPDHLLGPAILMSSGYWGYFFGSKADGS